MSIWLVNGLTAASSIPMETNIRNEAEKEIWLYEDHVVIRVWERVGVESPARATCILNKCR